MTLSPSWTLSRQQKMRGNCLASNQHLTPLSSKTALRSVQKMSGLFDTVQAGNRRVAGKASNPGLDMMEPGLDLAQEAASLAGLTGQDLEEILPDVGFGLMEGDFLDSFMDLSNFLQEDSKGVSAADSSVDNGTVNEKLDFSGIVTHLETEPAVTVEIPDYSQPSATIPSLRKRKHVEYSEREDDDVNVVDASDIGLGREYTISDHDYVTTSKKLKLDTGRCDTLAAAEVIQTSTSSQSTQRSTPYAGHKKYRERRDKNNEASRRSRQIRKQKYVEMDHEAEHLETRNEELRKKIVELEALAKTMKTMLIQKMTQK